jgi:hypothetical protein
MNQANTFLKAAVAAILFQAGAAQAALIQTTDRTAFNSATLVTALETHIAPANNFNTLGNATYNGVTYSSYAYMVDPGYTPEFYDWGTGAVLLLDDNATMSFDAVTAFAADFGTILDGGGNVMVTINGESFIVGTTPNPTLTFYGWISDVPFTSVSITTTAGYVILDNVTRGISPVDVPEPGTTALFGLAMLALALRRRT